MIIDPPLEKIAISIALMRKASGPKLAFANTNLLTELAYM